MRIGIDCRLWEQTGVGRYTRNIVLNLQAIDKKNQYVLFVRPDDSEMIKKQIANSKWKIVNVNIKWHSVAEQLRFPSLIKQQKLDLMHFPYFSVPIFYNRPYVVTIHDLIINHFSTGKASTLIYPVYLAKREAYKFIIRQAARNARKIIAPSNATKQEIMDHLKISENKIDVICEASELSSQQSAVGSQKYGKYFLYVGNAYPHKNLERLIQAFKKIVNEHQDLKLILVGQKDYFYQRLEKEYQSDNIIFYGKAGDKELVSLYTNAVALVAPSLMEGFGLPVLEAMSLRCLVVASDIPAFREIAGENALYFNPQDLADIHAKLKNVLENGEKYKEEKLEKAFNKSQQFSWRKAAEQTLNIYESCVGIR
ncbi:MAG TPA: glycosyltransferase family 1 protein [Patescibacteria group bacterium]|jgi:glycosyltransferase involved in cell wall biosynthesis|nr:glycosyltransferase family 1 protein [Patescibacteria group bacterium]